MAETRVDCRVALRCTEIDHNFSKAHRIVTASILPVVEQYSQHSRDAWEGTRFWKQFFEASANVSLSGYEEAALQEDADATHTDDATETNATTTTFDTPGAANADARVQDGNSTLTPGAYDHGDGDDETSIIDSPSNATGAHNTPRIPRSALKTSARTPRSPSPPPASTRALPTRTSHALNTPPRRTFDLTSSSPFDPPSAFQPPTAQRENPDPILHRVWDRNFRVQATPMTARSKQARDKTNETPATAQRTQTTRMTSFLPDSSPMSSPELAAPQLRSDLFSPEKRAAAGSVRPAPRTPGVSVQTPARNTHANMTTSTGRSLFGTADRNADNPTYTRTRTLWDDDLSGSDDDDADLMLSPPKTMHFHVPQSRLLLQTPAREASKMIVDDLLATAGADRTDEIEADDVPDMSPSVVGRKWEDEDDTF